MNHLENTLSYVSEVSEVQLEGKAVAQEKCQCSMKCQVT